MRRLSSSPWKSRRRYILRRDSAYLACGLDHLVYRPVANLENAMGEMVRYIVDAFRFLESNQRMVVTALAKDLPAANLHKIRPIGLKKVDSLQGRLQRYCLQK